MNIPSWGCGVEGVVFIALVIINRAAINICVHIFV